MGADQSASAKSGREEILYQATCVRWRFEHLIDVKTIFTSWVMTWSVVYAGLPTVKKTGVEKGVPWRTVEGLLEVDVQREMLPYVVPLMVGNVIFPRMLPWEVKSAQGDVKTDKEALMSNPDSMVSELLHKVRRCVMGRHDDVGVGQHRGDGAVPILILGGCFIDGGEGGGFGGYERLMHDAWEGHVDFETQAVHWKPWGTQMDERGRRWARLGMDVASCTKERDSHLVALLPGQCM
eukprot:g12235.t1